MSKITIIENNSNDKDNQKIFFLKGEKGETGSTGNGIENIELTSSVGNIDTYTITYTNGATDTFQVANGEGATVIVDNLTDTSTNKALSSNQGRVLKELIDNLPFITKLTETLYFVDGTAPTLETGFYYTNGYSVYFNGNIDSTFSNAIFYYESNRITLVSKNGSSTEYINYYWYYSTSSNQWRNHKYEITNAIGSTGLSAIYEIPTAYAINKVYGPQIRTGYLSNNYNVIETDPFAIPLDNYYYEGLKLTLENNGIVIGSDIEKVKVSGQVTINPLHTGDIDIDIIKRNSVGTTQNTYASSSFRVTSDMAGGKITINLSEKIISVSEGDTIFLYYTGTAGDIIQGGNYTHLTVEKISRE